MAIRSFVRDILIICVIIVKSEIRMGVFNFIETFFFISLGITFVLILLLVYHFKQRLNVLEQKGDTMFDIINNIVKEINMIKHVTAMHFNGNPNPNPTMSHPTMSHNESYLGGINEYVPPPVYQKETIHTEMDDSEDESADDSEDESADDSGDDSDNDSNDDSDDESCDDSGDDSSDESDDESGDGSEDAVTSVKAVDNKKIIVSDDDEVTVEKSSDKTVKIINVDINAGEHLEQIHEIRTEELNVDDDASESNADFQGIESSESSIAVSKLDSAAPNAQMNASAAAGSETVKTTAMDMYNKMSLAELKALVIQKGLSTDPGKMKRPKIITLLETALD